MHTFLFADLVGFTALSIERGDEEAADVARASSATCAGWRPAIAHGGEVAGRRRDGARRGRGRRGPAGIALASGLDGCRRCASGSTPARRSSATATSSARRSTWRRGCSQAARGGEVLLSDATRAAARRRRGRSSRSAAPRTVAQRARPVVVYAASERVAAGASALAGRQAPLRCPHVAAGRRPPDGRRGLPPRVEMPRAVFMTRFMLHPDRLLDDVLPPPRRLLPLRRRRSTARCA